MVVEKMGAYKKGQIIKFSKKTEMEQELAKIRETRRAYPSGSRGNWKIKVGKMKKKGNRSKPTKRGRKSKRC
jgi:hypothetical protein